MLDLFATPRFCKDLQKIPRNFIIPIDKAVLLLRQHPLNNVLNIKKLKGIRPTVWRVRLGTYRLIYSFTKTSLILHRLRHRKDIYKNI
jgi:mRNA-degrading endonuclease RelE of RelBE toxin-antitoxin system